MATVEQAARAKAEEKVVLLQFAGRYVTVNSLQHLQQANNGNWLMVWSHSDFPEAHHDLVSDEDEMDFIIHDEYASYRRPPGRPKGRKGEYERTAIDVRKDLLEKLDAKRGKMSRRAYIERLLETL